MSKNPPLDRAVEVAKSFDEKAHQLSTCSLTAFGIELTTRYSKCGEMIDMLQFAQLAAQAGAASLVKALFYDSKAAVCSFEWHGELDPGLRPRCDNVQTKRSVTSVGPMASSAGNFSPTMTKTIEKK